MTEDELAKKLRPVFAVFGREMTEDVFSAYFHVLGKIPRVYVDAGVKAALSSAREFLPPPGVLLSLCRVPPRFSGDGIPLVEETERRRCIEVTCPHHQGDAWYSDDPPPAIDDACPKCRPWRRMLASEPSPMKRLRGE
jgi:hypothetical protein